MEVKLNLTSLENVGDLTPQKIRAFTEVFEALIVSGSLSGIKSGSVSLHFDEDGIFKNISHNYAPWKRRSR